MMSGHDSFITYSLPPTSPFFPVCLLNPLGPQDLAQRSQPLWGYPEKQLWPALTRVDQPSSGSPPFIRTHRLQFYCPLPCHAETEAVSFQCFIPVLSTASGPERWLISVSWNEWMNEKKVWNGGRDGRIWGVWPPLWLEWLYIPKLCTNTQIQFSQPVWAVCLGAGEEEERDLP